ncbi:MAG: hypothetical protein M1134_03185 [Actinobacteria bacterium]|nr:hypothetical protein [Actinomycetota bacterium]MCL5445294.1 hypothetical protein [Actinomycetota bacterium]
MSLGEGVEERALEFAGLAFPPGALLTGIFGVGLSATPVITAAMNKMTRENLRNTLSTIHTGSSASHEERPQFRAR